MVRKVQLVFLFLTCLGLLITPVLGSTSDTIDVEVRASPYISGTREAGQSVVYFVSWEWLHEDGKLIQERAERALWNDPQQAPIVASFRWHGSVYGGPARVGTKLALVEKVANSARMTGPWEFGGSEPFRIGVDDQPLVAEMVDSRVAVAKQVRVKIDQAINTLSEAWLVAYGRAPTLAEWRAYVRAKDISISAAGYPIVRTGDVLVFDVPMPID